MTEGHWEITYALWREGLTREAVDDIAEVLFDTLDNFGIEFVQTGKWVSDE